MLQQLGYLSFEYLHIVFGMSNDKNFDKILSLLPVDASYYFCKPDVPRGMNEKELQQIALKYKLQGNDFESVETAIKSAQESATEKDIILITGSAFVVAEALRS